MNNKDKLISVAALEMGRSGYNGYTFDQLIATTGIVRSNVYYHFADKASLGLAVLNYWKDVYLKLIDNTLGQKQLSFEERLSALLDRLKRFQSATDCLGEPMTRIATDLNTEQSREICRQTYLAFLDSLKEDLPEEEATALLFAGIGALSACRALDDPSQLDRLDSFKYLIDQLSDKG